MLGWILLGLLCATTVVVVISGTITKSRIRDTMNEQDIKEAVITAIDTCENKVRLEDVNSGKVLELQGDGVAYELNERGRIYA